MLLLISSCRETQFPDKNYPEQREGSQLSSWNHIAEILRLKPQDSFCRVSRQKLINSSGYTNSMYIREKIRKSGMTAVQIVKSRRKGGDVRQEVVRHVGQAANSRELEELKQLAHSIMLQCENYLSFAPGKCPLLENSLYR